MALRALWRNRLYCLAVTLLLGLGAGASTLIFSCLDVFLLKPLRVANPETLVRFGVYSSPTHVNFEHSTMYARVMAAHARSFDSVFTFWPLDAAFVSGGEARTVTCEAVSENYFDVLGLRPSVGTFFGTAPADTLPAVLSHALWREAFGARHDVLGSGVRIRGAAFTIVGIGPANFAGLDLDRRADVWVPQTAWRAWTGKADTPFAPAQILFRLKPNIDIAQAESEIRVLYPSMVDADLTGQEGITAADIAREKESRITLVSAAQGVSSMRKQIAAAAPALQGGIGLLLLLAAAGAGALMRVRAESRMADTAVRLSLGASRWNIVRGAVAESLALAAAGALLALVIDFLAGPLLVSFLPSRRPVNLELHPDLAVLAFAIAASAAAALAAGIAPALLAVRVDLIQSLARNSGRVTGSAFGRGLVAIQIALATVLIAGSLGLVRSLAALRKEDPGFHRAHLVVAELDARMAGVKRDQVPALYREILRRARDLPGAVDASLSGAPLMRGVGMKTTIGPAGTRISPQDRLNVSFNSITETHLQNLGMRIVAGRNVAPADLQIRPIPAVVTESFAGQFFPHLDPLGREFGAAGPDGLARPEYRVAGVVRNVKYRGMREDAPPTFFTMFPGDEAFVTLHIRSRVSDAAMLREVRAMLASTGPGLAPVTLATMDQEIEASLWQERLLSFLSQLFSALALVIASLGCFSLVSYTLARRTREVGIRAALGATPVRIATLFAAFVWAAVLPGAAVGLTGFMFTRGALAGLLFGSGAGAAVPVAGAFAAILAAVAAAVAVPICRAAAMQPNAALRHD